jgi:hypothetical protein
MTRTALLSLVLLTTACSGIHTPPPAVDSGPELGDAAPLDALLERDTGHDAGILDANETASCAALHGATRVRLEALDMRGLGCGEPNFRCPCDHVPISDSCFDRLATANTCELIDQILADCNALDDPTVPVCPFTDAGA